MLFWNSHRLKIYIFAGDIRGAACMCVAEIIPVEPDLCNYNVGIMKKEFISDCSAIRTQNPVIHCITNYVAMNFNANALLAVGASPLMSFCAGEMREIVAQSQALYVNIGCPDETLVRAAEIAVDTAAELGVPWVLDPVGAGVSGLRLETCRSLISRKSPDIIRGNASEIMALAGNAACAHRGVDSSESSDMALESAGTLASRIGSVVVVSGATDYVTDGSGVLTVANGTPLMRKVSAAGCTASAICAAFRAVDDNSLRAAWCAMVLMGVAGERAVSSCRGTGSLQTAIIDELSLSDPAGYAELIKGGTL